MTERQARGGTALPAELDAERALIGAVLLGAPLAEVRNVVQPRDFYQLALGAAFDAALQLDSAGKPIDNITLALALEQMKAHAGEGSMLDLLHGRAGLLSLLHECPTAKNAKHYAESIAAAAERSGSNSRKPTPGGPTFIKAVELKAKVLAVHRWTLYGILAEGLALFVGRPKIGKSWWALIVAIAVALGGIALGQIRVEQGDVLYLSLEDNERRLKARMTSILGEGAWPERLTFATSWPRLDLGGLAWIEGWCDKHPEARLIIIDTLQKVRPAAAKNGTLYADDYRALEGLQKLAGKHRLTILVLHHTRKMASDDPLETVSGTQGLGGAADSVLVLKRDRSHRDATLFVTGRDVEESEITLRWDATTTTWTLLGDELSEERQRVIDLLAHAGKALHVRDIATALGRPEGTTRTLCWKMANDRQVLTNGKAAYSTNPAYIRKTGISGKQEIAETADIEKQAVVSGISSVSGVGTREDDGYGEALMTEPAPTDGEGDE